MIAKKKNPLAALPLSLGSVNKISKKVLSGFKAVNLYILVDKTVPPELLRHAREHLYPLHETVVCNVVAFGEERPRLNIKAELNLLIAGTSNYNSMLICQAAEFDIPLVVLAADYSTLVEQLAAREEFLAGNGSYDSQDAPGACDAGGFQGPRDAGGTPGARDAQANAKRLAMEKLAGNIIPAPAGQPLTPELLDELFANLGRWVARNLPDARQAFGRAYVFMREPICSEIINSTAFINAIIAAAFFIPGADMPILTANQAKMLIQIASIYGLELGSARRKEIAVLIAGAFGSRALARYLVARLSVVAWLVRGSLGYSTTQAIGRAAIALYSKESESTD
jgi:uncharacterized protein (DUF697 family)